MNRRPILAVAGAALALALAPTAAVAHTEADTVAVPAGSAATVKLKPTHGCGGSPTVEVAIQAPVAGATAGEVPGWTATASDDGEGHTVLEWKGGSLPADQMGEFPVSFTAPDGVGELLTFPAVQTCEDGQELSWISGDPAAEYPAPRVLVLAAGSEPAASLDEIPADAPGRDQLGAIVDVDNPQATTTTAVETTSTTGTDGSATTTDAPTTTAATDGEAAAPEAAPAADDDSSSSTPLVVGGIVVLVAALGGGAYALRRRSAGSV